MAKGEIEARDGDARLGIGLRKSDNRGYICKLSMSDKNDPHFTLNNSERNT